ncbi:CPBP family intramembrane glutamic endopeptidase [Nonomuraea aridisoli]|uniref:CAAX prenyl protease 2/Lysostaphin resistance protein A-like domain-containing protein n=1 Tax=Nonomuraea aridisoli TaxID=2070368 RepID=A0A2W2DUU1_9ACTN|nr:CPBP family intramembrane glutamic endopeptidase [Nonomuraea aridisoli]PZG07939.1 hypothetical protein C1J01_39800 [Nonomuraea aridisoli]
MTTPTIPAVETGPHVPGRALAFACAPFAAVTALALVVAGPGEVGARLGVAAVLAAALLLPGLALTVPAVLARRVGGPRPLLVAAGLTALTTFGLIGTPDLGLFGGLERNWQGRLIDLAMVTLLFALAGPALRERSGLTVRTTPGSARPVALTAVITVLLYTLLNWANGVTTAGPTFESLLFQLTLPGTTEELLWRGALLALLDHVFGCPWRVFGAPMGWGGVIVTAVFAIGHGVHVGAGGITLDPVAILAVTVIGSILCWIRARSGALWPAIVTHIAINTAIVAVAALPG